MSILTQRKVLVLNRGWNPIAVVTLERAMCLVCSTYSNDEPKARIMDPTSDFRLYTWEDWAELIPAHGEVAIHSARASFRIPEIILLSRYNKLPQQRIHFSRRTIYRRDGNKCQYCGSKPGTNELSIDHIIPRSRGGRTTWENCVLACVYCNKAKADKMPIDAVVMEKVGKSTRPVTYFTVDFHDDEGKQWKKVIRQPEKPKYTFYKGDYRCKSWEAILGVAYWETELQHDMGDDA